MAFIAQDQPSTADVVPILKALGPKFELEVTSLLVNPAQPDYVSAVQSAISSGAEAIFGLVDEPACVQLVTATSQLGFKGEVIAGACTQYIKTLGTKAAGTMTITDYYAPDMAEYAPSHIRKNLSAYVKAMKAAGQEKHVDGFALSTYSFMQELREILETIPAGPIDATSIKAAVAGARDIPGFAGPDVNCARKPWPTEPNSCRAEVIVLRVVERGGKVARVPLAPDVNHGFRNDAALAK